MNKKEILENARLAKLEKELNNKINPKKKTVEEELDEDLKQIKKLENLSKKLFNDENKIFEIEKSLEKYGNFIILPSKGRSKKTNYFRIILNSDKYIHKSYSRDFINKLSKKISGKFKELKLKGEISVGADFDGVYRNGEFVKFGRTPNFFEPNILSPTEEDEEVQKKYKNKKSFSGAVYFVHIKNSKYKFGGSSKNNDCLWYCINKTIPDFNPFRCPADLKIFLRLPEDAMISIDDIEKIEKKIGKVGINISGDFSYTSKLGLLKNAHFILENNHFTVNYKINQKINFINYKEKKILMVDIKNNLGFDGENIIEIDSEFDRLLKLDYNEKYIRTIYQGKNKKDDNNKIIKDELGNNIKYTLQEEYYEYIKMADEFKEKTQGKINFYKTGTILDTAKKLFDETTRHLNPELILLDEAQVINKSTHGATIFYTEYSGPAYKGDIKSMFPYILNSEHSLIPMTRGIFEKISKEDFKTFIEKNIIPYGLYLVKIEKSNNNKIDRWFRFDKDNMYTSIDIKHALLLGLKVELITDDDNDFNVILYPRKICLRGNEIFKNYIESLYQLKEQGIEGSKLLLNIISGVIGELNKHNRMINEDDESDDVDFDELNLLPISISSSLDFKKTTYTCVDTNKFFKSQFARFKPFLWAQARFMMTKLFLDENESIIKCYTDGIISTKKLNYSNEIGKLKYEGYCEDCKILNNANVQGKFLF